MIRFYATPISYSNPHPLYLSDEWFRTDEFLEFNDTVYDLCSRMNITILASTRVRGLWRGFEHPAMEYVVSGDRAAVVAACARIAARYRQDSVMIIEDDGPDTLCVFDDVFEFPDIEAGTLLPHLQVVGDAKELTRVIAKKPKVFPCSVTIVPASGFAISPNKEVQMIRHQYRDDMGYRYRSYPGLTENENHRAAIAYSDMPHDPRNPLVVKSYECFKADLLRQYQILQQNGFDFVPWIGEGQPYASSSEILADIERKKLFYYATKSSNKTSNPMPSDHPMLEVVNIPGKGEMCYNDIFRVVHDVWAHGDGNSIGPLGEARSWWCHRNSIHPDGWLALWCETRGQNCWTNFRPGISSEMPLSERPYPFQKCGVVGDEFL